VRDGVLSEEIAGLVLAEDPALPGARQQGEDLVLLMPAGELDETAPQGMGGLGSAGRGVSELSLPIPARQGARPGDALCGSRHGR
jgi:hypothetical protein